MLETQPKTVSYCLENLLKFWGFELKICFV